MCHVWHCSFLKHIICTFLGKFIFIFTTLSSQGREKALPQQGHRQAEEWVLHQQDYNVKYCSPNIGLQCSKYIILHCTSGVLTGLQCTTHWQADEWVLHQQDYSVHSPNIGLQCSSYLGLHCTSEAHRITVCYTPTGRRGSSAPTGLQCTTHQHSTGIQCTT